MNSLDERRVIQIAQSPSSSLRVRRASSSCLRTVPSAIPKARAASFVVSPLMRHMTAQLRRRGGIVARALSTVCRVATSLARSPEATGSTTSASSRRNVRLANRNPTR